MLFLQTIKNQNDREFVESLYNQYSKLMYAAAKRILRNNTLAEDAVQLAFERIIKYLHRIKQVPADRLQAYLIVVSKNVAKDLLEEEDYNSIGDGIEIISDTESNPINKIIDKENFNDLIDIVDSLKAIYKDVIILKYFCDFDDNMIADSLDITVSTYRKRLSRAKKKILELRKEYIYND